MGLEDLGAFDDEWNIGVSLSHRALPKLRGSNQDRQRSTFSIDIAIGEEEEPRALAITQRGSQALSETTACSRDSIIGRKACINNLQLTDRCTERRKLGGAKNGAGQAERLAKRNFERHHVGFAQRIDGRIGYLREALLEIIPERPCQRGKKRGRGVVAHAPVSFLSSEKRVKKNFVLVVGPAGRAGETPGFGDRLARSIAGEVEERGDGCRLALNLRGDALQEFAPTQEHSRLWRGENHFAGAEAVAFRDARFFQVNQARFATG